jgi:uncharacterized protein
MEPETVSETPDLRDSYEEQLVASFLNDTLQLILLPTEQCNFRCTYCYEDFSIGRMSPSTIRGVKRLIERRIDGLRFLSISWFGGEPLLARTVVEGISEHIVQAAAHRPALHYEGDMTTNGYLLDIATVERLTALGIRVFQISLDGPQKLHDQTRVHLGGRGSFDQIWRNLLAIRDSAAPVKVLLRIHLSPANLPSMPVFLREVRDTFLGDTRFSILLKPVERLGGPNNDKIEILHESMRPQILTELREILLDGANAGRLFSGPQVCYAARPNSLMIRANGIVGKCTVALSDSTNAIGTLLADGSLQIDNSRLRPWLRGWESREWAALECPYGSLAQKQPELLQIDRRVGTS